MATAADAAAKPRGLPPLVELVASQAVALIGAVLFAGLVGSLIIVAFDESPFTVYNAIWTFSTSSASDFGRVLENATPLIFSALALAVAFKAGMFNIGVEGQYIAGMAAAAAAATGFDSLPFAILLPLVILSSVFASTVWAAVPAVLKVKTGAHEVVTTIMMNGVALSFVAWALLNPLRTSEQGLIDLRTDVFPDAALMPSIAETFGLQEQLPPSVHLTWLFPLALAACALVWFLMFRTKLGYEVRAVGLSSGSAEAGGVSIGGAQLRIFLISGALAGFVGLNHLLGDAGFLGQNFEAGLGFAGIAVAFLGRNHPVGIAIAAILIGMLGRGQDAIQVTTELPREILIILEGILILSVVVAYEIARRAILRRQQKEIGTGDATAEATR